MLSSITRSQPASLARALSHGELLLISASLSAAATGELFGGDQHRLRNFKLFLAGASVILVSLTSLWFADITNAFQQGQPVNADAISSGSMVIFACSVITGGCCVILSET
jgi:hypothetical protein